MRFRNLNFDGTGQAVVVIDSGYDTVHTNDKLVYEFDFHGSDQNAFNGQQDSHGGAVAAVVNKYAADADIIHLKVAPDFSDGNIRASDVENGLKWVIDNGEAYNVAAVNISLGTLATFSNYATSFLTTEINNLYSLGIPTIIASGNAAEQFGVSSPANNSPLAFVVGAVDDNRTATTFTNKHPDLVDIYALGTDIPVESNQGIGLFSGTSFAVPQVAGAIAALQEASLELVGEKLNPKEIEDLIIATGDNGEEIYDGKIINTDRLIQKFIDEQSDISSITLSLTSAFDESFIGNSDDNLLLAGHGNDFLLGDDGNDQLFGREGNDFLIGGNGDDSVFFMGEKSQYTVIEYGTSVVTIDSDFGRDGLDNLVSIERFSFTDGEFQLSELLDTQDVAQGVYRFFNVEMGTHFFTQSTVERDSVINNLDAFNFEGPTFKAADPASPAADSVFRFFNTQTGTHFFTQSTIERDSILENLPQFSFEGEAYKGYTEQVAGSTPLYRFFNTQTGTHFYTAAEAEKDSIIENLPNFNFEGTAYWVDPVMG